MLKPKTQKARPPPVALKSWCTHESLSFDPQSGTYYLTCNTCLAKWMAVDSSSDRARFEALFQSYGVNEERRSLFYVKPIQRV